MLSLALFLFVFVSPAEGYVYACVHLLVGKLAVGFHKNYLTDFHKTWMENWV